MLNGLFFCCNNSDYFDKKDVNISNSQFETSTPKGSIEVFLKEELKNKLGLIILYSKKEDLNTIDEIKKDIKIRNILNEFNYVTAKIISIIPPDIKLNQDAIYNLEIQFSDSQNNKW